MQGSGRINLFLGLGVVAFALLLIFLWIPLDTESGITVRVRRQTVIGDALAPTLAGVFILVGGLMVLLFERNAPDQSPIDPRRLRFVLLVVLSLIAAFVIMRHAGPATVTLYNALTGDELSYRPLRGTVPWKYIGYFLGGSLAVTSIIALSERRLSARAIAIGMAATAVLIALYDLPFDDLLLPPNGDV